MRVSYRGDVYDVIGYSAVSRRVKIRLHDNPETEPKYVLYTNRRLIGLTWNIREHFGIPQDLRRRVFIRESDFSKDPIINTEP